MIHSLIISDVELLIYIFANYFYNEILPFVCHRWTVPSVLSNFLTFIVFLHSCFILFTIHQDNCILLIAIANVQMTCIHIPWVIIFLLLWISLFVKYTCWVICILLLRKFKCNTESICKNIFKYCITLMEIIYWEKLSYIIRKMY